MKFSFAILSLRWLQYNMDIFHKSFHYESEVPNKTCSKASSFIMSSISLITSLFMLLELNPALS